MSAALPKSKKSTKLPKSCNMMLLSFNADAKTAKSNIDSEYLTSILYLAPATEGDGKTNLCPWASAGCLLSCLFTAGRASFTPSIIAARIRKTVWYLTNQAEFMAQLVKDIEKFAKFAEKHGKKAVYRLDGTSDISIASKLAKRFSNVNFYDYTKSVRRVLTNRHANLHLTFSRSESNHHDCKTVLRAGHSVAVVFRKELPETYMGYTVVNGDLSDKRFLDRQIFNIPEGQGFIVGLKAKGKAKTDTSGFVVDLV